MRGWGLLYMRPREGREKVCSGLLPYSDYDCVQPRNHPQRTLWTSFLPCPLVPVFHDLIQLLKVLAQ